MLKQRIITALVLLALLLPALATTSAWPFPLLTLTLIGAAGWEWARLNQLPGTPALVLGAVVAAGAGWAWQAGLIAQAPGVIWWLAMLVWVLGGAAVLKGGVPAWPHHARALRLAGGLALLWLAWLAIAVAKARGLNFLLSVFCLVWVADISAYFGGRAFGRRKLALAISPGKSWEGVYTGMAGVLLLGVGLDRAGPPCRHWQRQPLHAAAGALGRYWPDPVLPVPGGHERGGRPV